MGFTFTSSFQSLPLGFINSKCGSTPEMNKQSFIPIFESRDADFAPGILAVHLSLSHLCILFMQSNMGIVE